MKLKYEGSSNVDNLFFSGVILYKKVAKKTIKFDYSKVRFQVWDYFNDFLGEN